MNEHTDPPAYQKVQREQPLSEYGLSYFNELLSEYRTLSTNNADPEVMTTIDAILRKQSLTWGDIYTFEKSILKLQPLEIVRRRAWALREKYRQLVGQQLYEVYLKSNPPDPDGAPEPNLRADLLQVLDNFHWHYTVTMAGERMRGRLSKWIIGLMALVVAGVAAAAIIKGQQGSDFATPTFVLVLIMGMLGGFVSTHLRLQSSASQGEAIENLAKLDHGWLSIFISPVSGAIFAAILYMLFTGAFLTGNMFPEIATPAEKMKAGLPFGTFATSTGPATGIDFSKLLVWSFIAGFAERFVPDALSRIVATKPEN
jgi:hypothetical protein